MRRTKVFSMLLGLCMALCLVLMPAADAYGSEVNENILQARKGILQVAVLVEVDGQEAAYAHVGTGFLVGGNDGAQTVITNYHVAHGLTEAEARQELGIPEESKVNLSLTIVVKRDVRIGATIVNESAQADFSILKLEQPIYDREPLVLADSDDVVTTQEVFALGFPGIVQDIQDDEIYTSDDVTVTAGIVSKTSDVILADSPIGCITHSAQVTYGNSGGPLVDSNGVVIGINTIMSNEEGNHDYFFSTKINEVREVLDALGIEYLSTGSAAVPSESEAVPEDTTAASEGAEDTAPESEAQGVNTALYEQLGSLIQSAQATILDNMTEDSAANFNSALQSAQAVYNDPAATDAQIQEAIDGLNDATAGLLEKQGMNTTLIIIIAAVAVVVIIVIVVIIVAVSSSKKKKAAAASAMQQKQRMAAGMGGPGAGAPGMGGPRPMGGSGPMPGPNGVPGNGGAPGGWNGQPQNGFRPQQPPYGNPAPFNAGSDGSAETSVLNDGAGETTLLSGGANLSAAFMVRKKNNERITISKQVFKIGKERRRVDYCISDNSNVSRAHADVIYKNGAFYIVDNNTTNGTTVNGASLGGG